MNSELELQLRQGHSAAGTLKGVFSKLTSAAGSVDRLRADYGSPVRSWKVEGRPFSEFASPVGLVRLGREAERSGRSESLSLRMRLFPRGARLVDVIVSPAFECIASLREKDHIGEISVLDGRLGLTVLSIKLEGDSVKEIIWLNLQ